jgi:hypothetical protein
MRIIPIINTHRLLVQNSYMTPLLREAKETYSFKQKRPVIPIINTHRLLVQYSYTTPLRREGRVQETNNSNY